MILSSGGTARFGLPNNGYLYGVYDFPGNTGDGYAMAFRAGAELTGFEYTLNYYIIKDINAPLALHHPHPRSPSADCHGCAFRGQPPVDQTMILEHRKDQGPLRIRMKHLPETKIKEIEDILFSTERPVQQRFFEGRGINFRTGDIELWPTEYYLCGGHGMTGIFVDEKAATHPSRPLCRRRRFPRRPGPSQRSLCLRGDRRRRSHGRGPGKPFPGGIQPPASGRA